MYLRLGNTLPDGQKTYTEIVPPDNASVRELLNDIDTFWGLSGEPGIEQADPDEVQQATPRWIAGDNPQVVAGLAAVYGCEVRELDTTLTFQPVAIDPPAEETP